MHTRELIQENDRAMHRKLLLQSLRDYSPTDVAQQQCRDRIIEFVQQQPDCLNRSCVPGHITGSAWLINQNESCVLLTHHKKLRKWLQLGGHVDGQPDILHAAIREAQEESGIETIVPVIENIFDVDIHPIPAHNNEPEHLHYDVRFLLRVMDTDRIRISEESLDLRWVSREEFQKLPVDESVSRMFDKWDQLRDPEPVAKSRTAE